MKSKGERIDAALSVPLEAAETVQIEQKIDNR